jgi:hypothetical protein
MTTKLCYILDELKVVEELMDRETNRSVMDTSNAKCMRLGQQVAEAGYTQNKFW